MRKLPFCIICVFLCFALCSCGVKENESEDGNTVEKSGVISETNEKNLSAKVKRQELIIEEGADKAKGYEQEKEIKNAADLRGFLDCLDYSPYTNDGLPEYIITFDDGIIYDINLSSGWVWKETEKEAKLTEDLIQELREFLQIE